MQDADEAEGLIGRCVQILSLAKLVPYAAHLEDLDGGVLAASLDLSQS